MKHLGLFEGIGGFSLAARWMGWETVAWCEINPFCQRVLRYQFPKAKEHYDIKQTDFTIYRGTIDVLTGGFPCQPYSQAGDRKGTEDYRHLWPEMLRTIREIRSPWVVGENVVGLINWSDGLVFEQIQLELENEGYEIQPFVLPAAGVDAPHLRERIFFIAYSDSFRRERWKEVNHTESGERQGSTKVMPAGCVERNIGFKEWAGIDTVTRCYNDGLPDSLDGITVSKWRRESLKAYGNAIVPQVALQIFKAIEQYENL